MTYAEEIEYAKKLLKEVLASIGDELEDEDMVTEDGREVVFVTHAIIKKAIQAKGEADAQCYLAAVERILDREADSVDRDIANMILKAEVQP